MLHRENTEFDSPNLLVDTLRDSLSEIHRIKSRLTDLQEQLSGVLMQIQTHQPSTIAVADDPKSASPQTSLQVTETVASFATAPPQPTLGELPAPSAFGDSGQQQSECETEKSLTQVPDSIDLQKWLLDRGVSIRQLGTESPFDESFDRIALRLGRDFQHLAEFYQALKRRIGGNGASKSIVLKNYSADRINRVVQFGDEMLRNGFLKEFRYIRNSRIIQFVPQTDGRVGNFITGNWLERYIVITVSHHLRKLYPGRTIEVLSNPRVILPDGNDFELDVLIACDSLVLWFECKTGKDYPAYLAKYSFVAKKVMQLARNHAAMILLEPLNASEKKNNSHVAGMTVLNLEDVPQFFDSMQLPKSFDPVMEANPDPSIDAVAVSSGIVPTNAVPTNAVPAPTALRVPALKMCFTDWCAVFNREQLRTIDAILRREIIEDFFMVNSVSQDPIPLRNIVKHLATKYTAEGRQISKAMINDIARALYRSGCCQLASHADYPNKVWFLRNDLLWSDAFTATALLYLWAGIKARENFRPGSAEAMELGRVIWGVELDDAEINLLIDRSVCDLQTAGRCTVNFLDNRPCVNAIGERFWNQADDEDHQTDVNTP